MPNTMSPSHYDRGEEKTLDVTNSCPVCNETTRRDKQLLDALQTAMMALMAVDGYNEWRLRLPRVRAALLEAMRLMQVRSW